MHSYTEAHKTADSCALFGSQGREFTKHSHRDARVDSSHFIVWHFNFTPQLCLPESHPFLSSPTLSLSFLAPQSLLLALLFSACLEEQSQSHQSLHFVTSLRMGLSLTPRHVRWEIFYVHQIRSACRPVAGRSSTLQHGGPNLYHCLSSAPSLHLFLSVFRAPSFFPPFTSCPPLFVIVSLTSAPFISLSLARCLSLALSLSSLFVHSLFVMALCFVYAKLS